MLCERKEIQSFESLKLIILKYLLFKNNMYYVK